MATIPTTLWPTDLPQKPLREGFQYKEKPNHIKQETGYGHARMRQRVSSPIKLVNMKMWLDYTQLATLQTFYQTTMTRTQYFVWIDHTDSAVEYYRFISAPVKVHKGGNYWEVSMKFETLPADDTVAVDVDSIAILWEDGGSFLWEDGTTMDWDV